MNFASVFDVPLIFFCRNNGYAISTHVRDQYRGDGIASRGPGYGIVTIRVDGNDLFAVYNATKAAREIAVKESRPVLIEAMTYRLGHHSTSDDSTAYRSVDEMNSWEKDDNPILRFKQYLTRRKVLTPEMDEQIDKEDFDLVIFIFICFFLKKVNKLTKKVVKCMQKAEGTKYAKPTEMFNEVFDKKSELIKKQEQEFLEHIKSNRQHYPLDKFGKL